MRLRRMPHVVRDDSTSSERPHIALNEHALIEERTVEPFEGSSLRTLQLGQLPHEGPSKLRKLLQAQRARFRVFVSSAVWKYEVVGLID